VRPERQALDTFPAQQGSFRVAPPTLIWPAVCAVDDESTDTGEGSELEVALNHPESRLVGDENHIYRPARTNSQRVKQDRATADRLPIECQDCHCMSVQMDWQEAR